MPKEYLSFDLNSVSNETGPQIAWMNEQLKLVNINEYEKQLHEYYRSTLK